MGFHPMKNFRASKDTITKENRQPTKGEKIFTNHVSEKGRTGIQNL